MDIGKRIVIKREEKGWSQRELARRVDLNPSVMNRIELGERPAKDQEIAKIASVLDTTSDYLLGRTDNPKSDKQKGRFFYFDKDAITEDDAELLELTYENMRERMQKRAEEKRKKNNP